MEAYELVLADELDRADARLETLEQTSEVRLQRMLVAYLAEDLEAVRSFGSASGTSAGLLLAGEVHLVDLERDEAEARFREAGGPVADAFLEALESDDPAMAGVADAAALWSLGEREVACETAAEVVLHVVDSQTRNEALLVWAGRSVSMGLGPLAMGLLDAIDAVPEGQNWRYQATWAMVHHIEGRETEAERHFRALEVSVETGGVPEWGLADAMATAAGAGTERSLACPDGWVGCMVDGEHVVAGGEPELPLDFLTLTEKAPLDVFAPLSDYPLVEPALAPVPEPEVAMDTDVPEVPEEPVPVVGEPAPEVAVEAAGFSESSASEEPEPAAVVEAPLRTDAEAESSTPEVAVVASISSSEASEPLTDASSVCEDLVSMEPAALLGRLSDPQVNCLEARLAGDAALTEQRKISLLLMADAFGSRDMPRWARLTRRHLDAYDQSNPDLCFRYAVYLGRELPGQAPEVILWSTRALENRTQWVGDPFTTRVSALYKMRAVAAHSLWEASGSDADRAETKVFARQWLEYARAAGKDTTLAQSLCESAAGTSAYCQL